MKSSASTTPRTAKRRGETSRSASRLVISYAYLWSDEHERGRAEGVKDRPCAIVVARRSAEDAAKGKTIVTVVPVTHAPPADPKAAIGIPPTLKDHLGLDARRSWIVLGEANVPDRTGACAPPSPRCTP